MVGSAGSETGPSEDEWGAAPTHPEADETPATGAEDGASDTTSGDEWAPAVDPLLADLEVRGAAAALDRLDDDEPAAALDRAEDDGEPAAAEAWEPAPPLPMALPAARPKTGREPKQAKRRGGWRCHRSAAGRGHDDGRDAAADGGDRNDDGRDAAADGGDRVDQTGDDDRRVGGGGNGPKKADRPPPTAEERLQLALKHAYRYLTKRDRTEAEVRAHLEKRETDPASLEAAIAELLELRYLDDERYVQRYVEDRRRLDGWGPVRITQGLRKTGIDKALIAPAIAAVTEESEDDDVTLATELIQRRFNHRPLDGDKGRQKALRAVVSKGHSLDVAYAAVRAYEERCAEDAGG